MNLTNEMQTMQVAGVEVRKTSDGWQYLSEGIQNEADVWCNASSALGPFGNAGVFALLDELHAARADAAQRANRVCKNCRWWVRKNYCDFIDTIPAAKVLATTGCEIVVTVNDDSGLNAVLKTAPGYSCPNFLARPSRKAQP
ncbi:hypothetical protein F2S72_08780 [Pseudomonas syringae pv. actinidiae]|nr:hypothetical protein [Pseudomonas syringae pv. actinidiae]